MKVGAVRRCSIKWIECSEVVGHGNAAWRGCGVR
jgi:hypothetical protein